MTYHSLGPFMCFAGLNTLVPRVPKLCVTRTSTVPVPRTSSTATTGFYGFLDGAAIGAYGADGRCADG